jgi:hypothetical protein
MKPDAKQLIAAMGAEYEKDEGFLGLLRTAHFDSHARDRFLRLLASRMQYADGRPPLPVSQAGCGSSGSQTAHSASLMSEG